MSEGDLTAGLFKLKFRALGTECEVQYRAQSVEAAKRYRSEALRWIRDFEATWSRFRPESLLCEINEAAGERAVELTPEQDEVIRLCEYVFDFTGGLLDPSSMPVTRLWDEANAAGRVPSDAEVEAALELVSWSEVEHSSGRVFLPRKGMALEIGGFGKEYAADQLLALAKKLGVSAALVDLGRDVATLGSPPHGEFWVVGVEEAQEDDVPLHRMALKGQALATSGNGRRFREIEGERFGHIIDARSGRPARTDVLTASCLAKDCLTAGLLSTTACLLGAEKGMEEIERHFLVEALLQTDKKTLYSQNILRHLLAG